MGGGVQTSTIAEMMVEGVLPPADLAIFADTGNESVETYKQIDYLKDRLGEIDVDLVTGRRSIWGIHQDAFSGDRFASIPLFVKQNGSRGQLRRQCTREYKVDVVERILRNYMVDLDLATRFDRGGNDYIRRNDGVQVDLLLGITTDEILRMKDNPIPWIQNRFPLIDRGMSRSDCLLYLDQNGFPVPPKSSCLICPYRRIEEYVEMKESSPTEFQQVVKFDRRIRDALPRIDGDVYLTEDLIPIEDAVVGYRNRPRQTSFLDECSGMCGV